MRTIGSTNPSVRDFLATHPVFTKAEFAAYLGAGRTRTRDAQLQYYARQGRIARVRRGLYSTVLPRDAGTSASPDPYLVASKMAEDAVLAYHTALAFYGRAHSHRSILTYLTVRASRSLHFRGLTFRGIKFPKILRSEKDRFFGVRSEDRQGLGVRVTGLERTLVDILDRPDLSGGWEEIWRSLESIEYFNLDSVIEYALSLKNATTIAKVGFYLEQHRDALMVEERHLSRLRAHRPRGRHYLAGDRAGEGRLVSGWNLIVPSAILERSWQEVR